MGTDLVVSTASGQDVPSIDGEFASLGFADVRRFRFSGRPKTDQTFSGNFVECLFEDIVLERVDFTRCDWKDCRLDKSTFIDCDLTSASVITNSFDNCRFIRCRFSDTSISNCRFRDCVFENSDLSNIIMKSDRIERTVFNGCRTSNRIIESSILLDTRWVDMNLEIDLILGNFGLSESNLVNCSLFKKTANTGLQPLEWATISQIRNSSQLSPIERFRVAYFETGLADGDSQSLEEILNPRNWSGDAIIESSFGDLLSNFSQFILALYADSRIPVYVILHFHTHNFRLLEWASMNGDLSSLYQAAAGVHLALTREVDFYASTLTETTNWLRPDGRLSIEAEGPLDEKYFYSFFSELGLTGIRIETLRPRNSPLELLVAIAENATWVSVVSIILASRTKIELTKISKTSRGFSSKKPSLKVRKPEKRPLVSFNSGFSELQPSEFHINIQTILPRSLLLDLHLNISIRLLKKARAVLLNLLQEKPPKSA